jgi:transcriptional regulator with XRE-family HTH domain
LREAREKRGLSQAALSRVAQITPSEINRLEAGTSQPILTTVIRLADALDISPGTLVRRIRI